MNKEVSKRTWGTGARSTFAHGNDCRVTFQKQMDNSGARVDLWQIVTGSGYECYITLMKRDHKGESEPWVFGSIYRDSRCKNVLWAFKPDAEKWVKEFFGDVFTAVQDDMTVVVFKHFVGNKTIFPLSKLLGVSQVMLPVPVEADEPESILPIINPTPVLPDLVLDDFILLGTIDLPDVLPEPELEPELERVGEGRLIWVRTPPLRPLSASTSEMADFVRDVLSNMSWHQVPA